MLWFKALDDLSSNNNLVLVEERIFSKKEMRIRHYKHFVRIANYNFKTPFWMDIIKKMLKKSSATTDTEEDVLETTGPGLLTSVYHNNKNKYPDITIVKSKNLCEMM
jgi:hypothetical protein